MVSLLTCTLFSEVYGQEAETTKTDSKTIEFMAKDGTLLQRDFYELGKVSSVDCQVLVITDCISNQKVGCMRLKTYNYTKYSSDSYIGTLDYDELEACIKSIRYIKDNLLNTVPERYTEVSYKTRDKVEVGAYYSVDKKKWTVYVQTKSYTSKSIEFLSTDNMRTLLEKMEQAKEIIADKVK